MKDRVDIRIFAFVFGVCLLWLLISNRIFMYQSSKWPQTVGRIDNSYVKKNFFFYEPVIEYKYHLNGKEFKGSHLTNDRFKFFTLFQFEVDGLLRSYSSGCKVTVFFNPKNPKNSLLRIRDSVFTEELGSSYRSLSIESILFFLSVLIIIWSIIGYLQDGRRGGGEDVLAFDIISRSMKSRTSKKNKD